MPDLGLALVGDLQKHLNAERKELGQALRGGTEDVANLGKKRFRQQILNAGLGIRLAKSWRSVVYPRKGVDTLEPAAVIKSKAPQIVTAFSSGDAIRSSHGAGFLAIPSEFAPRSRRRGTRGRRMSMEDFLEAFGNDSLNVFQKPGSGGRVFYAVAKDGFRRSRGKRGGSRRVKVGGRTKAEPVLMYTLVKQVRLGKRFDIARSVRVLRQAAPGLITQRMLKRLSR
ncbi:hypothetical protein LP7551_02070 [Roseibium album]|nr:hypothetical protein LP7551_02070 [Roseibium album]